MTVLKEAKAPVCLHCNTELNEWKGNVMVKESEMSPGQVISHLEVWCKGCTRELDNAGRGRDYHNLWELSWVKETYFDQLEGLLKSAYNFSPEAVLECVELGRILYDGKIKTEEEYE